MRAVRVDSDSMSQSNFEWTPDFWQGWRESENPYRAYKSKRDRELVLQWLQLHDGERVLEVGCGYGWISRALWAAAKIEWFGVDRSAEMVRHLRAAGANGDARASVADACRLPYNDGEFDKVVCTGVLMHIAEDRAAVGELVRVLRPGGLLVCSINNALSPYSLPVRLWNSRKKGFVQKFRAPLAFRRFLRKAGMNVNGVSGDGIIATVPVAIGKLQFPPANSSAAVCKLDAWATKHFAWLAYEIWFSSVKAIPPCGS
jgi:SAM-dependent methyltransferase